MPIQFIGNMHTAIDIGPDFAPVPDDKCGFGSSLVIDNETHAIAAFRQFVAPADQAFSFSHRDSSPVSATQASGRIASSVSRRCAPWQIATAATSALAAICRS